MTNLKRWVPRPAINAGRIIAVNYEEETHAVTLTIDGSDLVPGAPARIDLGPAWALEHEPQVGDVLVHDADVAGDSAYSLLLGQGFATAYRKVVLAGETSAAVLALSGLEVILRDMRERLGG